MRKVHAHVADSDARLTAKSHSFLRFRDMLWDFYRRVGSLGSLDAEESLASMAKDIWPIGS